MPHFSPGLGHLKVGNALGVFTSRAVLLTAMPPGPSCADLCGSGDDGTCKMDLWDSGCGQGANVYLCGSNPTQQLQALVTSVQAWGDERASAYWTLQTLKLNIFQFLPTRPRKWDAKKLLDSAPEKPPEDPNNWHPEVLQMQRDAHKPDLSRGPQNRQVWETSCWGSENDCPKKNWVYIISRNHRNNWL